MGFCISKCVSNIDEVYDPSINSIKRNNSTIKPWNIQDNNSIKNESDTENICRICFSDNDDYLENFCDCKGSIKWMHRNCLLKWVETSKNQKCRVCNKLFDIFKKQNKTTNITNIIEPPSPIEDITQRPRRNRRIYNAPCRVFWG